jgi:putative two-component system response regulator
MGIGQKTIFLVDDDITNLTTGADTLGPFYNTFTMNSGLRLLKMLEGHTPDLILLDVLMPEMDGYETLKILKGSEKTRNIPVVFLTAQKDEESEILGLSLGAIDYIYKPFSPPLLLKRIEMHLLLESQKKQLVNYVNNLEVMVEAKVQTLNELKNAFISTMAEMVEFRDGSTGQHIGRTEAYMEVLFNALLTHDDYKDEVSAWDKKLVLLSAQLHDVGKIVIKDSILRKPGKLTAGEFDEIKEHVNVGELLIERMKQKTSERAFLDQASILIAAHHEKWDGSGYPKGLKGNEIPLQGRMMAIADVYDALTSNRPYKKAFTHQEALDTIFSDRGKHFDPSLVDLFMTVADKFLEIAENSESGYIEVLEDL